MIPKDPLGFCLVAVGIRRRSSLVMPSHVFNQLLPRSCYKVAKFALKTAKNFVFGPAVLAMGCFHVALKMGSPVKGPVTSCEGADIRPRDVLVSKHVVSCQVIGVLKHHATTPKITPDCNNIFNINIFVTHQMLQFFRRSTNNGIFA